MKPHYSLLFLVCFSAISIYAKPKTKYPVAEIPEELIGNADAVIRNASYSYEYQSVNKAVEYCSMAITILKESALSRSVLSEYYNSFAKISDIEMIVYDKDGNKVKKLSQDDIYDRSAISGFSIYEDSRLKIADPKYSNYPFTVEYSYTKKYNSTYHFPNWYVIDAFNLSVEHSEFKVITPGDYQLRYREKNMPVKVEQSSIDGLNIYSWKVNNFKAFKQEPLSPPVDLWVPHVLTAPARFSIDNYEGDLSSWESFGSFYYQLNESQNNIPEETVNKVKSLLTDSMTLYEKVSIIHKFAQDKNRYISVQAGIGGIQPFDAATVDRLSYGDCKALTNYTMSLLKALDINCNYTLVQAGNTSTVTPDFPSDHFNHVFLSIPIETDTLWVECTNSHSPCGFIGDFTDDRYVLVVKENQSEIVKTPSYSSQENQQSLKGKVRVGSQGDAIANISYNYKGAQYPEQFALTLLDEKDRKKRITQSISAPNFELDSFDIRVNFDRKPELQKDLNIYLFNFVSKVGERSFFKLNTLNTQTYIPPYARGRNTPLYIPRNYSEKDSIQYLIQENMAIEAIPDAVEIHSSFGIYKNETEIDGNSIYYRRYLEINKGIYPKEQYNEFREFLEKVAKADASSAIIKPRS